MLECALVERVGQAEAPDQLQEALLLAAERGPAGAGRDEHRLDTERIAGEEQRACLGVPDREGEHATKTSDGVGSPVMEGRDDRLAVALGAEGRAFVRGELRADLEVVVDLAVEDERVTVGVLRRSPPQRLMRMIDVDDRQAIEAEHDVGVVPRAGLVRAAVAHAVRGVGDEVDGTSRRLIGGQQTEQATHQ